MKHILYCMLLLATAAGVNGCVEKDPEIKITQVLMVPLSPNALPVDFVIANNRQAVTVGYSSTVGTTTYSLPYYTLPAGNTEISYNANGTNTKLASVTSNLEEDRAYSTFLIDSASKIKMAFVTDDLSEPTTNRIKIRFLHFSPNAPAVNVAIAPVSATPVYTNLFTNRSFNDQAGDKAFEKFIETDPGSYTFQFKLVSNGTVAYTTTTLNLLPDRIYTLAARGFVGGAGNQALGGWLYPNKAQ
jgi:hypothetical protein